MTKGEGREKMILLRKFFAIILLSVAAILVASIVVTFSQLVAYFSLLFLGLTEGFKEGSFKDILLGILTYLFMAFMVYYLGRRGFTILINAKPEEPEPIAILDEADFSHSSESVNYFQTKYGYCHILADRIIFANSKTLEDITAYKEGDKIIGTLLLQFTLICTMSYYFYTEAVKGDLWQMLAPGIVVLVSFFTLFTSLKNSTTALIMRDKISSVDFIKGIPYLVTPHFIIWFFNNKNHKRKRMITLFDNDEKNSSEALLVFSNASLLVN